MKVMPTLEGGLRIDAEDEDDWNVLRAILHDASAGGGDLAASLGALVDDEELAGDWDEYVVPDLRSEFDGQLGHIASAIEEAAENGQPVRIRKEDGFTWYGGLNQARLALEEVHRFGSTAEADPAGMDPLRRSAFLRSQFYLALQSLLLDHVMA